MVTGRCQSLHKHLTFIRIEALLVRAAALQRAGTMEAKDDDEEEEVEEAEAVERRDWAKENCRRALNQLW